MPITTKYPTSATSTFWTNTNNAIADDSNNASATIQAFSSTFDPLTVSGFDFNIDSESVTSLKVYVQHFASDTSVTLSGNLQTGGQTKTFGSVSSPTSETQSVFNIDISGISIADINNGVTINISANNGAFKNRTINVDVVYVEVEYTEPGVIALSSDINVTSGVSADQTGGSFVNVIKGSVETSWQGTGTFSHDSEDSETLIILVITSNSTLTVTYDGVSVPERESLVNQYNNYAKIYALDKPSSGINTIAFSNASSVYLASAVNFFNTAIQSVTTTYTGASTYIDVPISANEYAVGAYLTESSNAKRSNGNTTFIDVITNVVSDPSASATYYAQGDGANVTIGTLGGSTGSGSATVALVLPFVEPQVDVEFESTVTANASALANISKDPGFVASIPVTALGTSSLSRDMINSATVSSILSLNVSLNKIEPIASTLPMVSAVVNGAYIRTAEFESLINTSLIVDALVSAPGLLASDIVIQSTSSTLIERERTNSVTLSNTSNVIPVLGLSEDISAAISGSVVIIPLWQRERQVSSTLDILSAVDTVFERIKNINSDTLITSTFSGDTITRQRNIDSTIQSILSVSTNVARTLDYSTLVESISDNVISFDKTIIARVSQSITTTVDVAITRDISVKTSINSTGTVGAETSVDRGISSSITTDANINVDIIKDIILLSNISTISTTTGTVLTDSVLSTIVAASSTVNAIFERSLVVNASVTAYSIWDFSIICDRPIDSTIHNVSDVSSLLGTNFDLVGSVFSNNLISGATNRNRNTLAIVPGAVNAAASIKRDLQLQSSVLSVLDIATEISRLLNLDSNVETQLSTGINITVRKLDEDWLIQVKTLGWVLIDENTVQRTITTNTYTISISQLSDVKLNPIIDSLARLDDWDTTAQLAGPQSTTVTL